MQSPPREVIKQNPKYQLTNLKRREDNPISPRYRTPDHVLYNLQSSVLVEVLLVSITRLSFDSEHHIAVCCFSPTRATTAGAWQAALWIHA